MKEYKEIEDLPNGTIFCFKDNCNCHMKVETPAHTVGVVCLRTGRYYPIESILNDTLVTVQADNLDSLYYDGEED